MENTSPDRRVPNGTVVPEGTVVIGPECFADTDETVICWRGRNYYVDVDPEPVASWERALLAAGDADRARDEAAADARTVLNSIIPSTLPVVRRALIEWATHRLNSVPQQ